MKTRISEIEAFTFLSQASKERTFPVFLLRPWPNANFLQYAVDKIVAAMDGQPFALGLDPERLNHSSSKPAQQEFDDLFHPSLGFQHYYEFIDGIEGAVPVLQRSSDANNLLRQLANATELDRGLVVHQQRGAGIPLSDTVLNLPPLPTDTIFVVDAGWGRDPLQMEAWALPVAQRIYQAIPTAEIVIMSSSFPESFGHIVGDVEELAHENGFFETMRHHLQAADLTYGDWGSTRLPQTGGGGAIPPRIDLARPASWHIFRAAPTGSETYHSLAQDAQAHPSFSAVPDCWGKLQVIETNGNGDGITGPKMNTSARINAHMTQRAGATITLDTDEQPFED
ncbi:beta family protein [Altererythrobacter sp. Z27]|uniref:beta family protein n=1 Tax=Altererythrobacter sp. Z27 TaxID=3461147 RepID=UPI004044C0D6